MQLRWIWQGSSAGKVAALPFPSSDRDSVPAPHVTREEQQLQGERQEQSFVSCAVPGGNRMHLGKVWEQSSFASPVPPGLIPCRAGAEARCWLLFPMPFSSLEGAVCPFSWPRVKPSLRACLLGLVGIEKQGGLFGKRHSLC